MLHLWNGCHAMQADGDNGQMNPASVEVLWTEQKLKRYLMAGLGLFLWALFVAEGMAEGRYHGTYPFFVLSGIAVLLPMAGLMAKRYRRQYLLATFALHLLLWAPCLYPIGEWPGGDDGPGMAWFWLLGAACLLDLGVTVKNLLVLCRRKGFRVVGGRRP